MQTVSCPGGHPYTPGVIQEGPASAFLKQFINAFILWDEITIYEVNGVLDRILCCHAVKAVKLVSFELGEPDASGRCRPVGTGEYEIVDVDTIIVALGTNPNPIIQDSALNEGVNIEVDKKGYIVVDEQNRSTNIPCIYAGGDVAPVGESNAINAMGAGKKAAKAINELLK